MNSTKGKSIAIVQARLGSSRLPMKSLLCLRGLPLIDWVARRLGQARKLDGIVIAVPDTSLDLVLAEHLGRAGIAWIAGPENDVLARFVLAARSADASRIVRVCADNPLIWGEAIDRLLERYGQNDCDYCYNHVPRNNLWPDGLGAEVLGRDLLEEIASRASQPSQREHCLNYIWDNQASYRIRTFDPAEDWLRRPEIKLDIDRPEDFARLARLPLDVDSDAAAIIRAWDGME